MILLYNKVMQVFDHILPHLFIYEQEDKDTLRSLIEYMFDFAPEPEIPLIETRAFKMLKYNYSDFLTNMWNNLTHEEHVIEHCNLVNIYEYLVYVAQKTPNTRYT